MVLVVLACYFCAGSDQSSPQESDGVQLTLPSFISNSTPKSLLCKILTTTWYLWKARNYNRFHRKTWTPWQVHHAVAAHVTTHRQAQAAGINTTTTRATTRNRPGGDLNEMLLFNEAISSLGLIELPLKGRRFTWSHKQQSPLLKRLDWFFTSACWTLSYPNTVVYPLINETSDHVPCVITISTSIPKHFLFRFENYWLEHSDFYYVVQQFWSAPINVTDAAKIISAKFKALRLALKT